MATVIIKPAEYDYDLIRSEIFDLMDSLGGNMIRPSSRVLIKPNLLAPATPAQAMLTHPMIVRAVAEYVLLRGAKPRISDSPATGFFERVLKESGIRDELGDLNVEFREFKRSRKIEVGEPFKRLDLAEDALCADVLINLPKLKTHSQMLLTLGVKNLFGCVVGFQKPEWHLRAGVDREKFATLLVKIHDALQPTMTILDGVLAMEGEGPGRRGTPKKIGVLMGSNNAIALDITVCKMLGIPPEELLTNKVGLETLDLKEDISIQGALPEIEDFKLPEVIPVVFGPRPLHGMLRKHLVQRPMAENSRCKLCGECWQYCPAQAIVCKGKRIHFDYDKCIRCYCCIEICPHGALKAEEPVAGKILRKIFAPKGQG